MGMDQGITRVGGNITIQSRFRLVDFDIQAKTDPEAGLGTGGIGFG